jgi:hypothetical protein
VLLRVEGVHADERASSGRSSSPATVPPAPPITLHFSGHAALPATDGYGTALGGVDAGPRRSKAGPEAPRRSTAGASESADRSGGVQVVGPPPFGAPGGDAKDAPVSTAR